MLIVEQYLEEKQKKYSGGGILAEVKGKLIVSNGSITKGSDFSLGMGNLMINSYRESYDKNGNKIREPYKIKLFDGWREI